MVYKNEFKSKSDMIKLEKEMTKHKVKCSCGHILIMTKADRTICSHCQKWVYRNKEIENEYKKREFEIKMKRMIKDDI